ncbi:MAG: diaminopimelate decarboxylase [Ruminococcus sp.]|nr:diaminopimelate decarboxylase [Ruminococcus sp.]
MKKTPFLTKEKAEEIIREIPTPFHIYDEKGIRENCRALYKAFSWNKGFKEYFAVKATPNPYLLQILKEEGCGADCSSLTELVLSEACGFSGDDIMFSSNVTPEEDMKKAFDLNAIINLDDINFVPFIKRVAYVPETICCRYNPGGVFELAASRTGVQVMDNPGEAKYGMTEEQMEEAFLELKSAGAKHFGIHAFLASNTVSNDYYAELAAILFKLAIRLRDKTGVHISFINLSGGIGVDYRPEEPRGDIAIIGDLVRQKFEEILVPEGMDDVKIFAELGRYMLAPYGAIIAKCLHTKHIYKDYIGLDACAANLMRPAMYGSYHHITVLGKENEPCTFKYDVTGGLCENNDKFAIDRMLPEILPDDLVYIHDTGAHGFSMGYNYNGKLRSAEVLLCEDGSYKLIRRAETMDDYFATFDFSDYHFNTN